MEKRSGGQASTLCTVLGAAILDGDAAACGLQNRKLLRLHLAVGERLKCLRLRRSRLTRILAA
jgi:hypothetical protein